MRFSPILLFVCFLFAFAGHFSVCVSATDPCANGSGGRVSSQTLLEVASATAELSTLASTISSAPYAAIATALNGPGPFTLFAPSNAAFTAAVNEGRLNLTDTAAVAATLQYHVIAANAYSGILASVQFPATLASASPYVLLNGNGQSVGVFKSGSAVTLRFGSASLSQAAQVTQADVCASNAVIHIIDRVLTLPEATSTTASAAGLTTLVSNVVSANLASVVDTTQGITVLAPNNAAFANIASRLSSMTAAEVAQVLRGHVIAGVFKSTDLSNGLTLSAINGLSLPVSISGSTVSIRGSQVLAADVLVRNGIVHVVDRVLLPTVNSADPCEQFGYRTSSQSAIDVITGNSDLSTLLNLVSSSPSVATALSGPGPFTIFAPVNSAFTAALNAAKINASDAAGVAATLTYHTVPGNFFASALAPVNFAPTLASAAGFVNVNSNSTLNRQILAIYRNGSSVSIRAGLDSAVSGAALVTTANVCSSNAVIHIIDKVLILPASTSATAVGAGLTSLANALTTAGLVGAVDTTPGITVFAPTNAAFSAAQSTLNKLDAGQVSYALRSHVVPSSIRSSDLVAGLSVRTLTGASITFTKIGDNWFANGARILLTDVATANGVVHTIDQVINVPQPNAAHSMASGSSLIGVLIASLAFVSALLV